MGCVLWIGLYLRSLSNMYMCLLFGLTQLPEVKNNQLILFLITAWLYLLHGRKQWKTIRMSLMFHRCRHLAFWGYLHTFKNVCLLIIAQQGEVLLNGQLCSGRIQTCGSEINKHVYLVHVHLSVCVRAHVCTYDGCVGCTFDPLAKLVQVMHWTRLTQFDLGFGAPHCRCCTEGLLQSQHHLIHLTGWQPSCFNTTIQCYLQCT